MARKHLDPRWQVIRKKVKPRLMATLPAPCPRCGGIMMQGMKLDVGHASRAVSLTYDTRNLRLEHRRCNRQDGQRIAVALRRSKKKRMPGW